MLGAELLKESLVQSSCGLSAPAAVCAVDVAKNDDGGVSIPHTHKEESGIARNNGIRRMMYFCRPLRSMCRQQTPLTWTTLYNIIPQQASPGRVQGPFSSAP